MGADVRRDVGHGTLCRFAELRRGVGGKSFKLHYDGEGYDDRPSQAFNEGGDHRQR